MFGIDEGLDAVALLLAHDTDGVAEVDPKNVAVYLHGEVDPTENINAGIQKNGVHVLVYDLGGDSDPEDANAPVIMPVTVIELYVDPTKRNRRKNRELRTAGAIRDDIMRKLHLSIYLQDGGHCHMEPRVRGYRPVKDPDFVCFRIFLERSIDLSAS